MGYRGNLLSVSFDKGSAQMGINGADSHRREGPLSHIEHCKAWQHVNLYIYLWKIYIYEELILYSFNLIV